MFYKIAINGYGRIGRSILRAIYESKQNKKFKIIAVNEVAEIDSIVHLTQYDTTHGKFKESVKKGENELIINNDHIKIYSEKDIKNLPWSNLGIDIVFECSGSFSKIEKAKEYIKKGAKKVVFSNPAEEDVDTTIVYGINDHILKKDHTIISNASCTSNCIIPVIKVIDDELGINSGSITTIHSMMNDQPVIDGYYRKDLRKTRSAVQSIIPVDTKLAKGIDRIFPHLSGCFSATALRVPTINVSAMNIVINVIKDTDRESVNKIIKKASMNRPLDGILGYNEEPLASCDFNHDKRSSIVDGTQTKVTKKRVVKIMSWFDNEWGYANRMLDTADALMKAFYKHS